MRLLSCLDGPRLRCLGRLMFWLLFWNGGFWAVTIPLSRRLFLSRTTFTKLRRRMNIPHLWGLRPEWVACRLHRADCLEVLDQRQQSTSGPHLEGAPSEMEGKAVERRAREKPSLPFHLRHLKPPAPLRSLEEPSGVRGLSDLDSNQSFSSQRVVQFCGAHHRILHDIPDSFIHRNRSWLWVGLARLIAQQNKMNCQCFMAT